MSASGSDSGSVTESSSSAGQAFFTGAKRSKGFLRGEILSKMRCGVRLKGLQDGDATNEDLFLGDLIAKNERESRFDGETTGDVAGLDPRVNWCNGLRSLRLLATCATGRGVGRSTSILKVAHQ